MILKDALKELDGQFVKIGAKSGSGFFYTGRVTELTENDIEKRSTKSLNELERYLKRTIAEEPDPERAQLFQFHKEKVNYLQKQLDKWTDIIDREVVEMFVADKIVEPVTTTVILVDGKELGNAWFVGDVIKQGGTRYA